MAETNPLDRRHVLWKTKRHQRMAVIVNALHALIAFSCFCFMHVDTGYDWGLTETLRTSSHGGDIKEKVKVIAESEGYESAEDFMWNMKVLARVVSVVKQVSFAYCLVNVLKLVTCYSSPHKAWNFEAVCTYVAPFVYFWSCIGVLGIQFNGQMPKPLWPFIVGAALGMFAMLTPFAYGRLCQEWLKESTESPD